MSDLSVRPIRNRLFILLVRAFTVAVLFITLVILAAIAYYLATFPGFNPMERLPIITRLETFYLVNGNWQGLEVLSGDGSPDFHRFWDRSILLDSSGKVVLDHGSTSSGLIGTSYVQSPGSTVIPITVRKKLVATLLVDASYLPARNQFLLDFLSPISLIAFIMAIPTIIIGLLLMRRFVTPLAEVIAAARAVAGGDFSARVSASGPGDLRALSDSFNHMAAALEQNDTERRNMLADIAHELRTPLTVMRGRLEGIEDGVYDANPEQIGPVLEETYLLERLVEDLRLLTLAETRQLHFEHRQVNLGEIAAHVIDLFQAEAEDKKIKLNLNRPGAEALAMLDPQRTEQVFGNLVSNALRYAPEGGNVTLQVEKTNGNVSLTITDDGPGVPADDLPNIFVRFWRAEKSRSRASGGAGLGLAITRQLVEAQGGQIRAENRPEGGLKITIQFPALA
ncbi:MAG TPA: ATP-binding protein [Anaerolineales bacterium]|jgi:signal transduction histidine kinase